MATLAEYLSKFRSLTLSNSAAYGHWNDTRAIELLNDAQYEVFKILIEAYDEIYFVKVAENLTPVSGEINLDTIGGDKPLYRLIAFERQVSSAWLPVKIVGAREAYRSVPTWPEQWYVVGRKLKSEASVDSNTYRILYHYRIPKLVNVGDVSEIPSEFDDMVPIGAAKMAALQARQKDDVQFFEMEWEKRKAALHKEASNRIYAKQMTVIDVERYGDGERPLPGLYVVS